MIERAGKQVKYLKRKNNHNLHHDGRNSVPLDPIEGNESMNRTRQLCSEAEFLKAPIDALLIDEKLRMLFDWIAI